MKLRRPALALIVAAALSGGAHTVLADDAAALTGEIQTMDAAATTKGSGVVTGKIASDFQSFAGSKENSTALVTGLRNGSEITLTQKGEPSATFTPATKPMGYGNVSTSLSLARYQLAQQGITNPTPEQLQTALNGGTITYNGKTVEYQGVLQMRADGMGWGQIAQQLGTKLGPVVSGIKSQNAHIATLPAAKHATTTTSTGTTTAARTSASSAAANGRGASDKGIVTASGASAAPGAGKGKADGVTSAGGQGASSPRGQGIVTAAGTSASPVAQGAGQGKAGAVTASGASTGTSAGGGSGNGKAIGHSK
jgi:antitoxin (DNA-binding transcriptional repressor) of toxin-antitoxin stability system